MPASRRFDGPDLESLLLRIEREAGTRAQIVKVEKVRSGGLLGFFAREHFEAEVVPGPPARDRSSEPTEVPVPNSDQEGPHDPTGPAADADEAPRSLDELVDEVSRAEVVAAAPDVPVRSFAEMLEDFSSEMTSEPTTGGGASGEAAASAVPPATVPKAPATPETPVLVAAPDTLIQEPVPVGARRSDWLVEEAPHNDVPLPAAPELPPAAPPRASDTRVAGDTDRLLRLGLPPRLIPPSSGSGPTFGALVRNLAGLPVAPVLPTVGGEIVAVVGDLPSARRVAENMCTSLGTDPEGLIFASRADRMDVPSWMVLRTPDVAERRRRAWRRRDSVVVVVVDASVSEWQDSWAHELLVSLEPAVVWAVAPAGAKVEDTGAWLDALGGVDAVALDELAGTTSPAAHLGLGVPIVKLDDADATAESWALLLTARLGS